MKRIVTILIIVMLVLSGCKAVPTVQTPGEGSQNRVPSDADQAAAEFALGLLRSTESEQSSVISPMSVLYTLGILSGGADSETLTEICDAVGMDANGFGGFLKQYKSGLKNTESTYSAIASGIWINDGKIAVKEEFCKKADAEIFPTAFSNLTKAVINNWISEKTNGLLDGAVGEISDEILMYIVNTAVFEGDWQKPFDTKIEKDFTKKDGSVIRVSTMSSAEEYYISGESERGFLKYYDGENYAFVALLPSGDIDGYTSALSGERLLELIRTKEQKSVQVTIPKIRTENTMPLTDALKSMGIKSAFDKKTADFSEITDDNVFVNDFYQKAYINVDESGTQAGGATVATVTNTSAAIDTEYLNFDKPFLYMVIDTANNLPIFIGRYMGDAAAVDDKVQFTCGNTMTRIYSDSGEDYSFMGGDSIWLSQLLADLEYSPEKLCKCLPMWTVDTEYKTGYGIDLGNTPYARCDKGQADLTLGQAERIEEILKNLRSGKTDDY